MKHKLLKSVALLAASSAVLAACSSSSDTSSSESSSSDKLVVSVDTGYVDYINDIKADFEKETGITVEVKEEGMIDTLDRRTYRCCT